MGDFYSGYQSSMDPGKNSKSFSMHNYRLGAPTSPLHAKQLEDFGKRLNSGIMNIEIGTLDPNKFEFIPQEHFEGIRQLADLTGAKPSLHGPLMDLAGFDSQSGRWSETERKGTVEHIWSMMERAHAMDPKGNLPVVFHAGATFSQEFAQGLKEQDYEMNPKTGKYEKVEKDYKPFGKDLPGVFAMGVVNPHTGEVTRLTYEEKYSILDREKQIYTPHRRLDSLNQSQWDKEKLEILGYQKEIEDLRQKLLLKKEQNDAIRKTGLQGEQEYRSTYDQNQLDIDILSHHIEQIRSYMDSSMSETFDKFTKGFKGVSERKKREYETFQKEKEKIHKQFKIDELDERIMAGKHAEAEARQRLRDAPNKREQEKLREHLVQVQDFVTAHELERSKALVREVSEMPTPQLWRPISDFAKEKTVDTISEVMLKAYKRFGDNAPMMAVENFWPNTPMSTAEELREAILNARNTFSKGLVKQQGYSKKKADKVAEKLIAATWDVGHINNLRKAGLEGEELKQKVVEETKKVADVVRHVHVTDNFGFHDSHLPPGMGNVPVAEMMQELDKEWTKLREQGKLPIEPRSIIEAGAFVGEIGQDPTVIGLEFFETPLYKMGPGPSWSQESIQSYGVNFVELPQAHFNLYGSSFTTLPKELGGQIGADSSRFSGNPLS